MVKDEFYKLALSDFEAAFEDNLFVTEEVQRAIRLNDQTDWTEKRLQDDKTQPVILIIVLRWDFI